MYIHRIVIDANRINTRGSIPAMNTLEALHEAGLVEIFQTSTLPAEFRTWAAGQEKARNYTVIGGSSVVYLTNGDAPDGTLGSSGRESRLTEIHRTVFGGRLPSEKDRKRAMRDALHLDQAYQHDADFFVTDDSAILNAASALSAIGVDIRVIAAEDCVRVLDGYFAQAYGTTDLSQLAQRLSQAGAVLLGSNSCAGATFADAESGETLLAIRCARIAVEVHATVRADDGSLLLTVVPGRALSFARAGAEVRMEIGPTPVVLGDKTCRSFSITASGQPVLSGRVLRNGRLLIYNAVLRNSKGRVVFRVARDVLECSGGGISAYPPP